MGCSFCNGLLPPCFLVWKTCLTQRASETSIFTLKRIQVSLSRCFPVRDIFKRSSLHGQTRWSRSWHRQELALRCRSTHGPVTTWTQTLPHPCIPLLPQGLWEDTAGWENIPEPAHPSAEVTLPQPSHAEPHRAKPRERMGQGSRRQDPSSHQAAATVSMVTQPITWAHPAIDICFACSQSWEAIITAPGS